ncbi:hypothetical protein ACIOC2_20225 [Streptomyces sp. NPDC088337]|uniref:hypothetical protein n=1 Tax=unclassified Streptomyces TaxID=2593676 RepID=UPI0037FEFB5A
MTTLPRLFHLQRDHDISGVSGTGRVANGVLWPDGTVALRWIGDRPSTVHWDRLSDAVAIHGHDGATRIVWADEQPPADRAAVLREAYEIAYAEGMRLNALEAEIGVGPYRGALAVAHLLRKAISDAQQERRMADEAQPAGLRGLLEHVGIDTTGRDITVAGRVVDEAQPAWAAEESEDEKLAKARRMAKALSAPPVAPPEWATTTEWPLRHKRAGDRRIHATARFIVNDKQRIWTACKEHVGKGGTPLSHMPVDCRACKRATAAEAQQDGVQPPKVPPMDPVHILGIEARKANR